MTLANDSVLPANYVLGKGDKEWNEAPRVVNGRSAGEALWNFAFELNDPQTLKAEHDVEALDFGTTTEAVFIDEDRVMDHLA